ncbi:hypothetical protein LU631_11645 [Erwinia tracheiphila]|uniref:hypothetical protein n=1 Tax=Erwinia tracheiphila TaxID=65700 RepID=UPI001F387E9D|nr:hypothetical protein [Erwinia tracheiphila]UIA89737.1 hypothetical protein LU631_11645 [Erwinia tracheiphila]
MAVTMIMVLMLPERVAMLKVMTTGIATRVKINEAVVLKFQAVLPASQPASQPAGKKIN